MNKAVALLLLNFCTVFAKELFINGIAINGSSLLKLDGNFTMFGKKQYYEGNIHFPINVGNNAEVSFDLYYRRNDWIHLVKLKEMDLCRFITNYFGKAFTALERNAGIAPGHCPIKSGDYHVNKTYININNLSYGIFPRGYLKIKYVCVLKESKQLFLHANLYFTNF